MYSEIKSCMTRRDIIRSCSALGIAGLGGTLIQAGKAVATGTTKITMQLGWLASNGILGDVAADHLGYFAEENLELDIRAGGPNIDGVASVASGQGLFGTISSSPSLMLARSAGIPVKCVAAGFQKHPFAYFSRTGNPVRTPDDLRGKRIATQGAARILLRALMAKNGISEDEVEVSVMGADMTQLMTGQVDVATGWMTNIGARSILGDEEVSMMLWDTGVKLYANPYYTTETVLKDNPEVIDAVLRAVSRGWGWVADNPEEAVEVLVNRYPNLDKAAELKAVQEVIRFSFDATTGENGWGTMDRENWAEQIAIYDQLDQFNNGAPSVDDVMTIDVLVRTSQIRPKIG